MGRASLKPGMATAIASAITVITKKSLQRFIVGIAGENLVFPRSAPPPPLGPGRFSAHRVDPLGPLDRSPTPAHAGIAAVTQRAWTSFPRALTVLTPDWPPGGREVLQAHVAIDTNLFREGTILAEVRRRHAAGLGPDLMLLPGSVTCCT